MNPETYCAENEVVTKLLPRVGCRPTPSFHWWLLDVNHSSTYSHSDILFRKQTELCRQPSLVGGELFLKRLNSIHDQGISLKMADFCHHMEQPWLSWTSKISWELHQMMVSLHSSSQTQSCQGLKPVSSRPLSWMWYLGICEKKKKQK